MITIRKAEMRDTERILELLSQVLDIHVAIRPDIFKAGTTKYTGSELVSVISDPATPVYVAVDEYDTVFGYAFCKIRKQPDVNHLKQFKTFFIDDLCVDEKRRGEHIGMGLFEYAIERAREEGCYEITLAVWEGNDSAKDFYEHMGMKPKETLMEYIL